MESLVNKVETQTATIAELKVSVDSMSNTVSSTVRNSYATIVKESFRQCNETPTSSFKRKDLPTPRLSKSAKTPTVNKPDMIGKSERVIGKPLSPLNQHRNNVRSNAVTANQKAIYVV